MCGIGKDGEVCSSVGLGEDGRLCVLFLGLWGFCSWKQPYREVALPSLGKTLYRVNWFVLELSSNCLAMVKIDLRNIENLLPRC